MKIIQCLNLSTSSTISITLITQDISFPTKQKLLQHISTVHKKKKPYQCSLCNAEFGLEYNLSNHMKSVHKRIKKHFFTVCGTNFSTKFVLNQHIKLKHSKEDVYIDLWSHQLNDTANLANQADLSDDCQQYCLKEFSSPAFVYQSRPKSIRSKICFASNISQPENHGVLMLQVSPYPALIGIPKSTSFRISCVAQQV